MLGVLVITVFYFSIVLLGNTEMVIEVRAIYKEKNGELEEYFIYTEQEKFITVDKSIYNKIIVNSKQKIKVSGWRKPLGSNFRKIVAIQ